MIPFKKDDNYDNGFTIKKIIFEIYYYYLWNLKYNNKS